MKRRTFLKSFFALLGLTALASLFYPLVRFLMPSRLEAKEKKLIIQGEIPSGSSKEIIFNDTPAIIINRSGKGLIALTKVCTHLGCLVEYEKASNRLVCPCHAGIYDLEGNVISGPPPKPLTQLPLRVEGENIVIG